MCKSSDEEKTGQLSLSFHLPYSSCYRLEGYQLGVGIMGTDHDDVRLLLSQELKDIRSKIVEGKLVLFVGEQASILVTPVQLRPSLDGWWHLVNHPEVRA